VRALYERGVAERAGLKLGDEIVAIDAEPALDSDALVDAGYDPMPERPRLFFLRPSAGSVDLTIRSSIKSKPRAVTLAAEESSGLAAGHRSVRVLKRGDKRIGVLHLWMVARGSAKLVQEALRGELAGCDALVVDLRGRGGFADEINGILAPFRAAHAKGRARDEVGKWTKPVVFLIDDRSRSAKELLAWNIRHERLGELVGEKTEGAVLGAGFMPLPGGLYLEVGMIDVPVADGSSLEGSAWRRPSPSRTRAPTPPAATRSWRRGSSWRWRGRSGARADLTAPRVGIERANAAIAGPPPDPLSCGARQGSKSRVGTTDGRPALPIAMQGQPPLPPQRRRFACVCSPRSSRSPCSPRPRKPRS